MDSINSFIHLLDKIETQDRRLGMTIKNLRCLTGGKSMELAYAMALKLAEESEKLTLLTRALPAYTGNPRALQDVEAVAAESVPIEAGFTIEGWHPAASAAPQKGEGLRLLYSGHPVSGAQELLSGQSAGSIPRKHHDIPPCI